MNDVTDDEIEERLARVEAAVREISDDVQVMIAEEKAKRRETSTSDCVVLQHEGRRP